jgi:hypothetical protein
MRAARSPALRWILIPLLLFVASCGCQLEIVTGNVPNAQVGVSYAIFLTSQCGGDSWFLQSGILPPGIGLRSDGLLSGTPGIAGSFAFTVGVFDFSSGDTAFRGLILNVLPAGIPTPTPSS